MRTHPTRHSVWLLHLCFASLIAAASAADEAAAQTPPRGLAIPPGITDVHTLAQNWSDDEAEQFYAAAQGSHLLPYRWFLHLEQPESESSFRDPRHLRSLGYLPRTPDLGRNPDGLPVGFVKDGEMLGLSCAACHTSLIEYQQKAWLIDGGPTLADVEQLLRRLAAALEQTHQDDAKFARFASSVLGAGASPADLAALKSRLAEIRDIRRGYNERNMPRSGSPSFGPGRVDAIGAIMNEVAVRFAQVPNNSAPADAPVSYPFLWDTPQHDYVQWNGSAPNVDLLLAQPILGTIHAGALSRNAGEVLGVFGEVDARHEGSLVELRGYASSVNKPELVEIEESLRKLWSPKWPAQFPAIDETLRAAGETLFAQNCRSCHSPIERTDENRVVQAKMRAVGTDQGMAANFALRRSKSGVLEGRTFLIAGLRTLKAEEPTKDLLVHTVLRVVARPTAGLHLLHVPPTEMLAHFPLELNFPVFAEVQVDNRKIMGAFDGLQAVNGKVERVWSRNALLLTETAKLYRQDLSDFASAGQFLTDSGERFSLDQWSAVSHQFTPAGTQLSFAEPAEIRFAYKARPLNGIWATAPYLHNGSAPNLDELLKPAAQRIKRFHVGSRQFDPASVGFRTDDGPAEFDTTAKGNSNAGHEYEREFSDAERRQLIEYMKSL